MMLAVRCRGYWCERVVLEQYFFLSLCNEAVTRDESYSSSTYLLSRESTKDVLQHPAPLLTFCSHENAETAIADYKYQELKLKREKIDEWDTLERSAISLAVHHNITQQGSTYCLFSLEESKSCPKLPLVYTLIFSTFTRIISCADSCTSYLFASRIHSLIVPNFPFNSGLLLSPVI